MQRLRFLLKQLGYDLASSLFARPALWIGGMALLGVALPSLEADTRASLLLATEPSSAQVLLGTLAGSMITVVAVVYSILLVALSLASMQFSTRILAAMTRDRVSQNTLGLFLGTFVYCVLVLRSVHAEPQPFVPGIALSGAIGFALISLGGLVWFIHHIVGAIQANHLVDRIATETEAVIDDVFSVVVDDGAIPLDDPMLPAVPADATVIRATSSGYIQLIDAGALASLGLAHVQLLRPMGAFVAAGLPLFAVSPAPTPEQRTECLHAVDVGPVRTMQSDVEFGIRQIVDIGLKAISPAVNDPSTAATCIDHLGRLLLRIAARQPVPVDVRTGVVVPQTTYGTLIDLSFEQLRQYGKADMAVCLRIMRVLGEAASVTRQPAALRRIELQATLLDQATRALFPTDDCDELTRRYDVVRAQLAAARRGRP